MTARTGIEWTEVTWNPTTGCDRIPAGCDHCYALTLAKRLKAMRHAKYQSDGDPRTSGPGFGLTVHASALSLPYAWPGHCRPYTTAASIKIAGHGADEDEHGRIFTVLGQVLLGDHGGRASTRPGRRYRPR